MISIWNIVIKETGSIVCERLVQKNINDGRRFNITVNNVDIPDQAVFKPSYLWLQAPILSPNISISYFDFFHHFPLRPKLTPQS